MPRSRSPLRTPVTRRKGYRLTLTEEVATALFGNTDNANLGNLVVRVDEDPSAGQGTGNDTFDGTETRDRDRRAEPRLLGHGVRRRRRRCR